MKLQTLQILQIFRVQDHGRLTAASQDHGRLPVARLARVQASVCVCVCNVCVGAGVGVCGGVCADSVCV